jgi:hypothetical protein
MFAKQDIQANSNIEATRVLKSYVEKYYPSLTNLITEPQYKQLAWIDYERCTNQALLLTEQITMADFPFQKRRIIERKSEL